MNYVIICNNNNNNNKEKNYLPNTLCAIPFSIASFTACKFLSDLVKRCFQNNGKYRYKIGYMKYCRKKERDRRKCVEFACIYKNAYFNIQIEIYIRFVESQKQSMKIEQTVYIIYLWWKSLWKLCHIYAITIPIFLYWILLFGATNFNVFSKLIFYIVRAQYWRVVKILILLLWNWF